MKQALTILFVCEINGLEEMEMRLCVILAILSYILVAVIVSFGWLLNIIALIHTHALDGLTIARGIGAFIVPIGSVLGYFA